MDEKEMKVNEEKNRKIIMIMFLLGIFISAMDSGIVSPARTVIADSLNISADASIWMITLYTLVYAVSMPVLGKIADRRGKKKVFVICISIFGIGSLMSGFSDVIGSYHFLIFSRIIQAIGGGGIMPIATAYIGDSFPKEKRGAALGIVGATYGIATTLGPTIGSFILDTLGNNSWGLLFLINVPICVVVVIKFMSIKIDEIKGENKSLDIKGSIVLSLMILGLMYGVTNLNFSKFKDSITSIHVYPYLILFFILIPFFIRIEKNAEDPVLNLNFFKNRNIVITLIMALVVGCGMMSVVFIPQFGENVLRISQGSGGYLITIMAVCSGFAAPIGGKLIDKYSAKAVLLVGFTITIISTLILGLVVCKNNSAILLFISLGLMGIGMGLSMGTPLNYIMQVNVKNTETSSAQATLSLVKSIGIAVSPNILVNFVAEAGDKVPGALLKVLPPINGVNSSVGGSILNSMPKGMLESFQNANVSNIVDTIKNFAGFVFDKLKPLIENDIAKKALPNTNVEAIFQNMKGDYIVKIENSRGVLENTFQATLNSGFSKVFIASAIIAGIGFIVALFLTDNKVKENKNGN